MTAETELCWNEWL